MVAALSSSVGGTKHQQQQQLSSTPLPLQLLVLPVEEGEEEGSRVTVHLVRAPVRGGRGAGDAFVRVEEPEDSRAPQTVSLSLRTIAGEMRWGDDMR